jgi:hypothetical protein
MGLWFLVCCVASFFSYVALPLWPRGKTEMVVKDKEVKGEEKNGSRS